MKSVPSERDESGVIIVAKRDVKLLAKRPKADDLCVAVQVRVPRERYEACARRRRHAGQRLLRRAGGPGARVAG